MFHDTVQFAKACPECAITYGIGRRTKVPLYPIPVRRPFQILGIDVLDLPVTERGNSHVVVIQVHQNRVCPCTVGFPSGYYWYGRALMGPRKPPTSPPSLQYELKSVSVRRPHGPMWTVASLL